MDQLGLESKLVNIKILNKDLAPCQMKVVKRMKDINIYFKEYNDLQHQLKLKDEDLT